jgi:hypothetical protein
MNIPGSNLLAMASRLIAMQSYEYYQFISRTPNSIGQDVASYAGSVTLQGSIQPVPRLYYQQYGLDLQRNYNIFYVQKNILDLTRDVSGDKVNFNGNDYQVVSKTDWFQQDGWDAFLAVQIIN